ncbi:DUF4381 domain-containing protein [Vibrio mexicanus]|uniref:DUF4381 domain-containing protein n=1 Tax=Vibrio mexicanus TaxID=1004326 RepID=UPI00069BC392|nr:DUF4381 domain-containing protein [Vibrio mexicanus]
MHHQPPSTYILRELADVEVMDSVSWWPQTIGWKVLFALLVIALAYVAYKCGLHWWQNRYRQEALDALANIQPNSHAVGPHFFNVIKAVLTYLSPSYAKLISEPFFEQLTEMSPDIPELDESVRDAWMTSLVNPNFELNSEDAVILQKYCLAWVKYHVAYHQTANENNPDREAPCQHSN